MTYEEAMEMLTRLRDYEFVYREDAVTAYRMACEALEKQIPKKPVYKERKYSNTLSCNHVPFCSVCGGFLWSETERTKADRFCKVCGQAIDWSEEK